MMFFLVPSQSTSKNSLRSFYRSHVRKKARTQSFPPNSVSAASPNVTLDVQVYKLFEDILKLSYVHIHGIQENLQYWSAIAKGSDTRYNGVQFKFNEETPLISEGGVLAFEPDLTTKGISPEISSKINILMCVRYLLNVFRSKVHKELMIIRKLKSSPENLLAQHIATVEGYISKLKDGLKNSVHSISGIADLGPFNEPMGDEMLGDAVNRIYGNVCKMDMYLSSLVAMYRRPSKMLQKWMVTVGAIGVVTLSMWIFNQNGPLGIMDNTVVAIKDFIIGHVKEPLTDLKGELFNKSMKRDMELMEVEQVRLSVERLRSMLLEFIEQTTYHKSYTNKSNEEILELVDERYAEEIKSPICGIIKGDLVQAGLIQVHKLKVDFLTQKLSVNKIMRANGLTFAIAAASPTIGVFSLGVFFIYQLVNRSKRKGRLARRRLLQQIEGRLIELQCKGEHEAYWHGLLLYTLDQLYKAIESPAKATQEWESVREELINLGEKQGVEQDDILRRLKANYACLAL